MTDSTGGPLPSATPELQQLVALLGPPLRQLAEQVPVFRQQPPTPERTYALERRAAEVLREAGRVLLEQEYNRIEPPRREDCPLRLRLAGQEYRRRPKSRNVIGTWFGPVTLWRYAYEATEAGERSLFPREMPLGVEAGLATPALAERVGLR